MRKATLLLCAGMLLSATSAQAEMAGEGGKEYAKAGVIDVGATFTGGTSTTEYDDAGEVDETQVILAPTVAYFLMDGVALVGQVNVGLLQSDDGALEIDATLFGLGLGAAYLMDLGSLHVGPALLLRYDSLTAKLDAGALSGDFEESGPGATAAVIGKLPVGGGGLINLSLYYTHRMIDTSFDLGPGLSGDDEGTDSTIGTSVGFSVYF